MSKSKPIVWRDAIRDDRELGRTARLVAHTLSTYMNAGGHAWPSVALLAIGSRMSQRGVQKALRELEAAGYLDVSFSAGRSSNSYTAILPSTVNPVRGAEWATLNRTTPNPEQNDTQPRTRFTRKRLKRGTAASKTRAADRGASLTCEECHADGGHHTANCSQARAA
jgi:hypothetical protein